MLIKFDISLLYQIFMFPFTTVEITQFSLGNLQTEFLIYRPLSIINLTLTHN